MFKGVYWYIAHLFLPFIHFPLRFIYLKARVAEQREEEINIETGDLLYAGLLS